MVKTASKIEWGVIAAVAIAAGLIIYGIVQIYVPGVTQPRPQTQPQTQPQPSAPVTQPNPPYVTPNGSGNSGGPQANPNLSAADQAFDIIAGTMPFDAYTANLVMQSSFSTEQQIATAEGILGLVQPISNI